MMTVNDTGIVLYRYLRALSVKVSQGTVHSLLDTPAGNSLRGISDALDALRIKNEVYQLPPSEDYFAQVDAPFITMRQVSRDPFCAVTKKDGPAYITITILSVDKKRTLHRGNDFISLR